MSTLLRYLKNLYQSIVRSVAFLPTPMLVAAFLLIYLLSWLEYNTAISEWLQSRVTFVSVFSQDTARSILAMFAGGLITLSVFTFSQIMVLLNQVTSAYSPRLLTKMTGDRKLQFALGFNIATVIVMIGVMLSIKTDDSGKVPNLSVLVCIVLGIACLCLFVYFVAMVSKRIQINNIIHELTREAVEDIERAKEDERRSVVDIQRRIEDWPVVASPVGGYLGTVAWRQLAELCAEQRVEVYIIPARAEYIPKHLPLLRISRSLPEETLSDIVDLLSPVAQTFDDWHLPHIKQLTEIGVKAMSPGINDPGTMITVLDQLAECLGHLMALPNYNCYTHEGQSVYYNASTFPEVVTVILQSVRRYCREDGLVMRKLTVVLFQLLAESGWNPVYSNLLNREIRAVIHDARRNLGNPHDRALLANDIVYHRRRLRNYLYREAMVTNWAQRQKVGVDS